MHARSTSHSVHEGNSALPRRRAALRVLLLPAFRLLLVLALILLFILLFPTSAGGGRHGYRISAQAICSRTPLPR